MIVTCKLPEGSLDWRPDPFPGSDFAIEQGCRCPLHQPHPGALAFETECPIPAHQLEGIVN